MTIETEVTIEVAVLVKGVYCPAEAQTQWEPGHPAHVEVEEIVDPDTGDAFPEIFLDANAETVLEEALMEHAEQQ